MPTKDEMSIALREMGLKRAYKPYCDDDHDSILLETRRFGIIDGVLKGSEIDVYDGNTLRIWTSRRAKAASVAKANGFKVRFTHGEAELYIPASVADQFLHSFGAKVKATRNFTPEQLVVIKARLSKARANRVAKPALAPAP